MNVPVVATALAVLLVAVGISGLLGLYGRRRDGAEAAGFRMAARGVSPAWNAAAIGGEYLTAAAFLGTAGLVLAYGADMLWMPVGATAAYVLQVALITAPVRRSGAYTVADFAEWRLESPAVRWAVTACVCFVGWLCLLPQFRGAGITLRALTGGPLWAGWAVVAAAVLTLVLGRGVRSLTSVQAVQYWVKLVAVVVPMLALVMIYRMDDPGRARADEPPRFGRATPVHVSGDLLMRVGETVTVSAHGWVDGAFHHDVPLRLIPGPHAVRENTDLRFPAGAAVPHVEGLPVQDADTWATPLGRDIDGRLLHIYSMILCCALGTMGLPHILMRFYTSATGWDARRTAAHVPVLLALFAFFPAVYGALGRLYTPELLMTGDTDATVLTLPSRMMPGTGGAVLTGLLVAGAFAAFVSASCGVVVAIASALAQVAPGRRGRGFRHGTLVALAVPPLLMLGPLGHMTTGRLITLGFGMSAVTLFPLLVLAIWWRGLTAAGACAGMVTGAGLMVVVIATRLPDGTARAWPDPVGTGPLLLVVPVVVAVMVAVSLLTRERIPRHTDRAMTRMHLPEDVPER